MRQSFIDKMSDLKICAIREGHRISLPNKMNSKMQAKKFLTINHNKSLNSFLTFNVTCDYMAEIVQSRLPLYPHPSHSSISHKPRPRAIAHPLVELNSLTKSH